MPDYNEVKAAPKPAVDPSKEPTEAKPQRKLQPVGKIQQRKRGVFERLVVGLIGPDGLPSIGNYLSHEVILPAVKDILANSLTTGIQMAIFGKDAASRPVQRTNYSNVSRQPYYSSRDNRTYRPQTDYNRGPQTQKQRQGNDRASNFNPEDYIMDTRDEAMSALTQLQEYADEYNQVSLADFFDLMGIDTQYTDNNYGWMYDDVMKGKVVMIRGGYALRLPRLDVLS